jgi:hypothetical protein
MHITIILPVVLYGCETWSVRLREEHRLMVFDSRVIRKIFRPKRDEITGNWRGLHKEELYDSYLSPSIIWVTKSRRIKWAGHIARMGDVTGAYGILVGKREGMKPLGR